MVVLAKTPNPIFTDIDGNPLENGYIFIGESGLDAESYPQDVYWDSDFSTAATSIRTKGGMPLNGTVTGKLFAKDKYSITVKDKRGEVVFTDLTATDPNDAWELTEGRPALDERIADVLSLSSDDWVTIAEYPDGDVVGFGASFFVDGGDGRIMHFHCEFRNNAGTIEIFGDGADFIRLKGARIAYNSSSSSTGAKIQVLCDSSIAVISTQMQQFSSKTPALSLYKATDTDNDLVPSGATASFLVAGAEKTFFDEETFTARWSGATLMYVTIPWGQVVKPDSNSKTPIMTITGLSLFGAGGSVSLDNMNFTYYVTAAEGDRIILRITDDVGGVFSSAFTANTALFMRASAAGNVITLT